MRACDVITGGTTICVGNDDAKASRAKTMASRATLVALQWGVRGVVKVKVRIIPELTLK